MLAITLLPVQWCEVNTGTKLNGNGRGSLSVFMPTYFLLHLWIPTTEQPQQPNSLVPELQVSPGL